MNRLTTGKVKSIKILNGQRNTKIAKNIKQIHKKNQKYNISGFFYV